MAFFFLASSIKKSKCCCHPSFHPPPPIFRRNYLKLLSPTRTLPILMIGYCCHPHPCPPTLAPPKKIWNVHQEGVFHTWSRVVSAMERVRSKNLYTNSFTGSELWNLRLMFLKTLALIYGFLLYLKPVKVQCYRITHVHNYQSRSTTILWKIRYLILFGHIKTDFVRYLIWICLKSQLG